MNCSNKTFVIICAISTVLVLAICVGAFFAMRSFNPSDMWQMQTKSASKDKSNTGTKPEKPTESLEIKEENAPGFQRFSTYSPDYSYTGMDTIHSSSDADDKTALEVADEIKDFNDSWVDFVNNGNRKVFDYLREGTQAHKYAIAYGDKNITEEYIFMDVNDVRSHGNTYYVWTNEVIEETSDDALKEKVRHEYYWVYKVTYSDGGYYVEDYIRDPAYK